MNELVEFLSTQNNKIEELYKAVAYSDWMAATTGTSEWAEKNKTSLGEYYAYFANSELFEKVKSYRKGGQLTEYERRQLDDLYFNMIKNQMDSDSLNETLEMENEISKVFNTYRPTMDGQEVSNNDLLTVLKTSNDHADRKKAWLASKQIGKKLEDKILELVHKRNKDAQALGFTNYYEMNFMTQELDIDEVFNVFHNLLEMSDTPFQDVKEEIDQELCEKFDFAVEDIRPWHYVDPFFQEAPPIKGVDIDDFYKGIDLVQIARNTFESMGLEIDDILEKSDLYPRKDKNPFGFCADLDRKGDIRILVNLENNQFWGTALLHELGHVVYAKYIDRNLPFLLRFYSHTLTTEASALLFGRLNKSPDWVGRFLKVDDKAVLHSMEKALQRDMLVSARWFLTFSFFERELYENPNQDLNERWWELVERIQFLNPPEDKSHPDWASKMHFSLAPVSYQNYLLGELTASQLQGYIENHISKDFFKPEVGKYLKDHFFTYGAIYDWNEKIKQATGEYLNPQYFIQQFLK